MKPRNERLSPKAYRELQGIYVLTYDEYKCPTLIPVVPPPEPLTADNFAVIVEDEDDFLTVDDFQWFEEDGTDRSFIYNNYYDNYLDIVPNEVSSFLNTTICLKFATHHLEDAKAMLEATDKEDSKQEINAEMIAFNEATDNIDKLQIASNILFDVSDLFDDIDDELSSQWYNAGHVINSVLKELADIS